MIIIKVDSCEIGTLFLKYGYLIVNVVDELSNEKNRDDYLSLGKIAFLNLVNNYDPKGKWSFDKYIKFNLKKETKKMIKEERTEYCESLDSVKNSKLLKKGLI